MYEQPIKGSKILQGQDVHGSGYFSSGYIFRYILILIQTTRQNVNVYKIMLERRFDVLVFALTQNTLQQC